MFFTNHKYIFFCVGMLVLFSMCKKEDNNIPNEVCGVTIKDSTWLRGCSGRLVMSTNIKLTDNSIRITEHGHCWSTSEEPPFLYDSIRTKLGKFEKKEGVFTEELSFRNLNSSTTTYFFRSYVCTEKDVVSKDKTITVEDTCFSAIAYIKNSSCSADWWLPSVPLNFQGRVGAISFVINNVAYIGTGYNGFSCTSDMWRFDYQSQSWTQISSFASVNSSAAGKSRRYAIAFVVGNYAYAGLGDDGVQQYGDLYRYEPLVNRWTEIKNTDNTPIYPDGVKSKCFAFSVGGYGYVGGGQSGIDGKTGIVYSNNMYKFDTTATGRFVSKTLSAGSPRTGAVAMVIEDRAYLGLGIYYDHQTGDTTYLKDWWLYDASNDTWIAKVPFPATPRTEAVGMAIDDCGCVGLGVDYMGSYRNLWYQYYPDVNKWFRASDFMGKPRRGAIAFSFYNRGFVLLGKGNDSTYYNDMYEYRP